MTPIFLKQVITLSETEKGKISGIAYTGDVIKDHFPYKNLIIDLSTLKVFKEKTPLFRDHNPSQVVGSAKVEVGDQVTLDGRVSAKSKFGQEIIDLSDDGFEWELSMGLHEGKVEEIESGTVNGREVNNAVVLRNGLIREISVVALGADMNTQSSILQAKKGDPPMNGISKERFIQLACACGGNKDTTPEELEQKFAENEEEVDKLQKEIDGLKAQIAAKEAEIAKYKEGKEAAKEKEETSARTTKIEAAVKEKGVKLSAEKIAEAAKSESSMKTLLSVIEDLPKLVDPSLVGKTTISTSGTKKNSDDAEKIRLQANQLVAEGKASSFIEAIEMVEGK